MTTRSKKDYMALQNAWNICVIRYLTSYEDERLRIIDDFRDSLVDIKPDDTENEKNLRTTYENWEKNIWLPDCKKELDSWVKVNSFEAGDITNLHKQYEFIKRNNNYKRFRKILQVIQDSGIGLGQSGGEGHYVGPTDIDRFTR